MADVTALLKEHAISEEIINEFLVNMISTVEDLKLLSDDDLAGLVPLIGPRNRIKAAISQLNKSGDKSQQNGGITLTADQEMVLSEIVNEVAETMNGDNGGEDLSNDHLNDHLDDDKDSDKSSESSHVVTTNSRSKSAKSKPSKGRTKTPSGASSSYDLEEILDSAGGEGQLILDVYRKNGTLTDSHRGSLAKLIINHETAGDFGRRVTKDRAEFLASKVTELFKSELMSTWYRTESRSSGKGKIVKGRIIRRYYTQRRGFKRLGVLTSTSDSDEEESEVDADLEDSDAEEGTTASLTWLANKNVTPWPRVLSSWKETSKRRIKELQKPVVEPEPESASSKQKNKKKKKSSDAKVTSYTETYPQITEPLGWTLLEIDFEYIQKNALMKMDLNYQKLEKFVLQKLRSISKDYHFDDFDQKTQCDRSLFVFLSLSQLFPVITVANAKKANWRPSRQEMKDSFLLKVKSHGDLRTILEARQTKLTKFNLTCQPIPVVIKEKEKKQTKYKCLVKYDNFEYVNLESPIKAVDVAFKSYHALHAFYPPESEQLWLFLQRAVYGFDSKWDKKYDSVDRLVCEYSKFNV